MPISPYEVPGKQPFVETYVEPPFAELMQLGRVVGAKKAQNIKLLKDVSDDWLGIKATERNRVSRNSAISAYKDRAVKISQMPLQQQDAYIAQLAEDVAYDVNYGNLGRISQNYDNEIANLKDIKAVQMKGEGKYQKDYSNAPRNKMLETKYGDMSQFIPGESDLDAEGNIILEDPTQVLQRADLDQWARINMWSELVKAKKTPQLIKEEIKEGKATGRITITKEGIEDTDLYDEAYNKYLSRNVRSDLMEQMQIDARMLSDSELRKRALKTLNNITADVEDIGIIEEQKKHMTKDEMVNLAAIHQLAQTGHEVKYGAYRKSLKLPKGKARGRYQEANVGNVSKGIEVVPVWKRGSNITNFLEFEGREFKKAKIHSKTTKKMFAVDRNYPDAAPIKVIPVEFREIDGVPYILARTRELMVTSKMIEKYKDVRDEKGKPILEGTEPGSRVTLSADADILVRYDQNEEAFKNWLGRDGEDFVLPIGFGEVEPEPTPAPEEVEPEPAPTPEEAPTEAIGLNRYAIPSKEGNVGYINTATGKVELTKIQYSKANELMRKQEGKISQPQLDWVLTR